VTITFGAHCYLFTDRWSDDRLDLLDTARALGLGMCEIAIGDDVIFDYQATRARAEALGLQLTVSPGGEWPAGCDLSSDVPQERANSQRWHENQIDVAAALGAGAYTGALYGRPGTVRRRLPPPDEGKFVAEGVHRLADYGAARGVRVVLEPMSHFRTHLVNTPQQLVDLIAQADHPNLYGLLDTYHLVTEVRDYAAAIRMVGSRLWGLHACESDRGVPGGGLVPWDAVFSALREINFDGVLMLETYNSTIGDPPGSFAHSRGMFHDPCPDGAAFVRHGIAFLRDGLAQQGSTR
jgi:D-psicose/D-tagatose/L-ribulose 3-epimerase